MLTPDSAGIVRRRDADEAARRRRPGRRANPRQGRFTPSRPKPISNILPASALRRWPIRRCRRRGRAAAGNFVLSAFKVKAKPALRSASEAASADFEQQGFPVAAASRRQGRRSRAGPSVPQTGQGPHGRLRAGDAHRQRRAVTLTFTIWSNRLQYPQHVLGQVPPFGHIGEEPARRPEAARRRPRLALAVAAEQAHRPAARPPRRLLRRITSRRSWRRGAERELAALKKQLAEIEAATVPVMRELPADQRREDADRNPRQLPGPRRRGQRRASRARFRHQLPECAATTAWRWRAGSSTRTTR